MVPGGTCFLCSWCHCWGPAMAGRSRCSVPGSRYPPGFQSIANYHQNALLSSWRGGEPGARNMHSRGIQPCPVWKTVPLPLLLTGPSVSHSESAVPFCVAPTPHFISTVHFSFLALRQRRTARNEHSCTISLALPFTSQHLIRDPFYGVQKSQRTVKYARMS